MDGRTHLTPRQRSSTLLRQPRVRWLARVFVMVPPKPQAAPQWPLLQRALAAALEAAATALESVAASIGLLAHGLHPRTCVRHRPTRLSRDFRRLWSSSTAASCP